MADTPKLGQSASMENSGSELTLPPMNQTTAMTVAESMDANAPAEHDFFRGEFDGHAEVNGNSLNSGFSF